MQRLKIVMLGTMARMPFGGHVWVHLNWLLGCAKIGHEIWYVEDDQVWPFDPDRNTKIDDFRYALQHIPQWMRDVGLPERCIFRLAGRKDACWGASGTALDELYRSCDVLINMAGATALREPHLRAPLKVMLHTDPVTAEIRIANGDERAKSYLDNHDFILTCAENYLGLDCRVPLNGMAAKYRGIRQAVDLDLWSARSDAANAFFTTIGNYRQTGDDVAYQGEMYRWSKHFEWEKFIDLPRRTAQRFRVALGVRSPEDRRQLQSYGWELISPLPMSYDVLGAYRDFIRNSRAEWTVAKDQNVRLRSGWFSDRDATYLASGKPVIAQATGFENYIPTGKGLFHFHDMADILQAVEEINGNYLENCSAARAIAQEYFEAGKMARSLLEKVGAA